MRSAGSGSTRCSGKGQEHARERIWPKGCIHRSGVKLTTWVTGDDIEYRDTGSHKRRSVFVTPDCEPCRAYVQWMLK